MKPKMLQQFAPREIDDQDQCLTDKQLCVALFEFGWLIEAGTLHAPSDRLASTRGCIVSNPINYKSGYSLCLNCIRDSYNQDEIRAILKQSNNNELSDQIAEFEIELLGYEDWLKQSGLRRVHKLSSHPDLTRRDLRKLNESALSDAQARWALAVIEQHPTMAPLMMLAIEVYLAGLLLENQDEDVVIMYQTALASLLDMTLDEMDLAWEAHEQVGRLSLWRLRSMKLLWATIAGECSNLSAAHFPEFIERIEALHKELASIPRDSHRTQIETSLRGFKIFDWMQYDIVGPARHNKGG